MTEMILDRFQVEAIAAIDAGRSVVVSAPTGSGKTLVAEHAIDRALEMGGRAFYTTPIKALSNQKFRDLRRVLGADNVGLLTGDNVENPDAAVVVMTTEVLRNMIYANSDALDSLSWVILDEVHYLEDPYRGPVWEEVIIHLASDVGLVCLSATVSNANELTDWITTLRGPTDLVVETVRPVPLNQRYLVAARGRSDLIDIPILMGGKVNKRGRSFDAPGGRKERQNRGAPRAPRSVWMPPRRTAVVQWLDAQFLLPTIYFLFSRQGCADAAVALHRDGVVLTTAKERRQIVELVALRTAEIEPATRVALDFEQWSRRLEAGIAAHHAGMIPAMKEAVELCFAAGLLKVVFGTETLALGVNMPARSIVLEQLSKYTGEGHALLTPGQYKQMTGRAGRRGLDEEGTAVVLWSRWNEFDELARLAASSHYELRSAFRPTYNMATNLILRHDREEAMRLLSASFGQFQADRREHRADDRNAERAERAIRLRGEIERELPAGISLDQLLGDDDSGEQWRDAVEGATRRLQPGDAVDLGRGTVAVLSVAVRGSLSRLRVLDLDGSVRSVHSTALHLPPEPLGRLNLPDGFIPTLEVHQEVLARELIEFVRQMGRVDSEYQRSFNALRRKAKKYRDLIGGAGERGPSTDSTSTPLLLRQFEQVLEVLAEFGCTKGWSLTEKGGQLSRLFTESDLLVAHSLDQGLFDGLDPASLTGLVSMLSYEHRSPDGPPETWWPSELLRTRAEDLLQTSLVLNQAEKRRGLRETPLPDSAFVGHAYGWAEGAGIEDLLADGGDFLSPGDFVRTLRQVADLVGQIALVSPIQATRLSARSAVRLIRRGLVMSTVEVDMDQDDGSRQGPPPGAGE